MSNLEETGFPEIDESNFERAKQGFELFGQDLKPFSPSRVIAAQNMGMRYPHIGETAAAQFEETGMYPGMLEDVIILLWLCGLEDRLPVDRREARTQWTPDKAAKNPAGAKIAAVGWAATKGIFSEKQSEPSAQFLEAIQVFMAIATGQEASKFKLNAPGAGEPDDGSPKV